MVLFSAPHSLLRWRGQGKPKVAIPRRLETLLPGGAAWRRLPREPWRAGRALAPPRPAERCGADAGQRYRYLDWGSTGDLDDTAMLAQQARKPMTPAHTAAEPPDVPIRSLGSVFPATLLTNG